ncbi:MAG: hypothetical protein QOF78_2240 [Phycisphaerales bacterium]|nr:hypothetical protein [Phycisphaerales bacterium]
MIRAIGLTTVFGLGFGLAIVGCQTQQVGQVGAEPRGQIAYAATAKYPQRTPETSSRFQLAAVDDPDDKKLTLMNLSDNAIPPSTAWINGAFVYQLPTIPPRGMAEMNYSEILMAGPNPGDLKQTGQSVRKVELQTQDGLYTVQGPSKKTK